MNWWIKAFHGAPKGNGQCLMTKANAQNRRMALGLTDQLDGDAGILWNARAGRDDDPLRPLTKNCLSVLASLRII